MGKDQLQQRYRAFISYSQKDKAFAKKLHAALESYKLPNGKRLGRLFRDDDELGSVSSLSNALENAIEGSEDLIVIASPNAVQSRWVNQEVIQYKKLNDPKKQVFAVILDGEPNSADPEKECFVPALRFKVNPDGTLTDIPDQPLAPDARKEPFKRLVTKVVAALEGIPFDNLWQRQKRRERNQKLMFAVAGLAIAAPLAIWGLSATNELGKTTSRLVSLDPATQREVFLTHYYDEVQSQQRAVNTPEEYILRRTEGEEPILIMSAPDLNMDGFLDYYVKFEHIDYCGSGGCRHELVLAEADDYRVVYSSAGGDLQILETTQAGMRDIGVGFGGLEDGTITYQMLRYNEAEGRYDVKAYALCNGSISYCGLNTVFTDNPQGDTLDMVFTAGKMPTEKGDSIPVYNTVQGAKDANAEDVVGNMYDEIVGTDASGEFSLVHIWKGTYGIRKNP